MTDKQDPISNAARLLRAAADELKACHTLQDSEDWTQEPDAKAAYDEHVGAAEELEAWQPRAALAQQAGEPTDGWLQQDGLLYRLTDERHPCNRDEINVKMADGSRSIEARTKRATWLRDCLRATPQPAPEAEWVKAKDNLPPCRDDQLYLGVNSAGFAGVFNAVADIAGCVHCMYETAEETIDVLSDLAIWQAFTPPPPARKGE